MSQDFYSAGVAEPPKVTSKTSANETVSGGNNTNQERASRRTNPLPTEIDPPRRKGILREYFESAVVTIIMALFGMTFIVQAVTVPTGSMQNTIVIGDHLLVNKFIFAPGPTLPFLPQREIKRGDIIVFKYPGNSYEPEQDATYDPPLVPYKINYVKRVIGMPGDRISLRGDRVVVNGQLLAEHVITAANVGKSAPLKIINDPLRAADEPHNIYVNPSDMRREGESEYPTFSHEAKNGELVVPDGKYFVMGDNRDDSADSRFWGFVPRELVIGRAMFVYWSYDETKPKTGFPYIQDFFNNTRWSRTGTLIK